MFSVFADGGPRKEMSLSDLVSEMEKEPVILREWWEESLGKRLVGFCLVPGAREGPRAKAFMW